jgi:hypothetical protein
MTPVQALLRVLQHDCGSLLFKVQILSAYPGRCFLFGMAFPPVYRSTEFIRRWHRCKNRAPEFDVNKSVLSNTSWLLALSHKSSEVKRKSADANGGAQHSGR